MARQKYGNPYKNISACGRPLETLAIIINLIANTTTGKGLAIKCGLDSDEYKTGRKVTDEELGQANII